MTDKLDLVSFDIVLGQIPTGEISGSSSNIPTGLNLSGLGTKITVAAGTVRAGEYTYTITEPLTKDLTVLFEPGNGQGSLLYGDTLVDGTWFVYATTNGKTADVLISQSLTPLFPHDDPHVTEEDFYSGAAYKFFTGYRIGAINIHEGVVAGVYPQEDLASAYINHDLVFQSELEAAVNTLSAEIDSLGLRTTAAEDRLSALEPRVDTLESDMDGAEEAISGLAGDLALLDARVEYLERLNNVYYKEITDESSESEG